MRRSGGMMGWASVDHGPTRLRTLPSVTTSNALRFVHAKTRATFWTQPLGIFFGNMALHPDSLDARKICNDAHPIFRPVPIIEMKQIGARVLCTQKAEPMTASRKFFAVFDGTGKTGV